MFVWHGSVFASQFYLAHPFFLARCDSYQARIESCFAIMGFCPATLLCCLARFLVCQASTPPCVARIDVRLEMLDSCQTGTDSYHAGTDFCLARYFSEYATADFCVAEVKSQQIVVTTKPFAMPASPVSSTSARSAVFFLRLCCLLINIGINFLIFTETH